MADGFCMSDAGVFLINKAKERRRDFARRAPWLLVAVAGIPLATAATLSVLYGFMPPAGVGSSEAIAFCIGAGVMGAVCAVLFLLRLDGGQNLRDGAEAERNTEKALRPLKPAGWMIFHDVQLDGRNIDHVLIGPRGAIAVETKWTTGDWRVTAGGIIEIGLDDKPKSRPLTGPVADAVRHARDLRLLLRAAGVHTEVLPAVVLWGPRLARIDGGACWIDEVLVANGAQSREWLDLLTAQPLSERELVWARDGLRARKEGRWVGSPTDGQVPPKDVPEPAEVPKESALVP